MTFRILIAALLVALAACTETTTVTRASGDVALRPDRGGLAVAGGQRIDFGRAEAGTVAAVTRLLGTPLSSGVNGECGAGPTKIVKYRGMDLLFRDGAFAGWVAESPRIVAGNGLAPGVTRQQLAAGGYGPFRATSLGVEFESDGIFGLLPDNDAATPVQLLWSGTSCFFR